MRRIKYALLGLAVAVVFGLACFDQFFPIPDPSIWLAYAEMTGLRPSSFVTSALWRLLISLGFSPMNLSVFAVGLLAFALFDMLWRLSVLLFPLQEDCVNWWRLTVPCSAFVGCCLAIGSEPVWRMALSGAPELLSLALFALSVDLFLMIFFSPVQFDEDGQPTEYVMPNLGVYAALLVSGLLAVDTPVALVLPVFFVAAYSLLVPRITDGEYRMNPDDLLVFAVVRFSHWVGFILWLVGVAIMGLIAGVLRSGSSVQAYLTSVLDAVAGAASPVGWALWLVSSLVPLLVVCCLLPGMTAANDRSRAGRLVTVLLAGAVAFASVLPVPKIWYWNLVEGAVRSPFMLAFGTVLAAVAVAFALLTLGYFTFHVMPRNYGPRLPIAMGVGFLFLISAGSAVEGLRRSQSRMVRQVIADAVTETLLEAKDAKWIFTDGSIDVGIELAAHRRGWNLFALPLADRGAFATPANARARGLSLEADVKAVRTGSEALLRDWIAGGSSNVQASAVQDGLALWNGKDPPKASGFLARTGEWPADTYEFGIMVAKSTGRRMVDLVRSGALKRECDEQVKDAFTAIGRCLSRMARLRGETAFADELDAFFPASETNRQ